MTVLATGRAAGAKLPAERDCAVHSGRLLGITGWLGAFTVEWEQENPIDLGPRTYSDIDQRALGMAA